MYTVTSALAVLSMCKDDSSPLTVPNVMIVRGVGMDGTTWNRSCVDVPGNPQTFELRTPALGIIVLAPDRGWRNLNEVQGVSYGRR